VLVAGKSLTSPLEIYQAVKSSGWEAENLGFRFFITVLWPTGSRLLVVSQRCPELLHKQSDNF
jgi:hypothetical protein